MVQSLYVIGNMWLMNISSCFQTYGDQYVPSWGVLGSLIMRLGCTSTRMHEWFNQGASRWCLHFNSNQKILKIHNHNYSTKLTHSIILEKLKIDNIIYAITSTISILAKIICIIIKCGILDISLQITSVFLIGSIPRQSSLFTYDSGTQPSSSLFRTCSQPSCRSCMMIILSPAFTDSSSSF